jgi:hypothetical protein
VTACRYDRDKGDYLTDDGDPCKRDDYGDPTKHCSARRACSQHVGPQEQTCARCIGRTRSDIRTIRDLSPLMSTVALCTGVNSEAANLAGPAVDPRGWSARKVAMRQHLNAWLALARITERQWEHALLGMPDDDERHPYIVTTRWQAMLSEEWGHPLPARLTVETSTYYLDRNLARIAQDPAQDFPLLHKELRKCRQHLENVLSDSRSPERGVPCPTCGTEDPKVFVRLVRKYAHFCDDIDCDRMNYVDTSGDMWVCPRDGSHEWGHSAYVSYLEERREA